MKKFILFITLSIFTLNAQAQDSIPNINIPQAERIIDKYSSQIAETFEQGLEKVTPIAEEGFKMVVKFQLAKGIILMIPFFIFWISLYKLTKFWNTEHFNDDDVSSLGLIWIILLIITFILSIFCTYGGVTRIIAPEWYAIKEIIELFK